MGDEAAAQVVCATYTHARRHPMVMGRIGGWTPPFQVTLTQLGVLIVTVVVETQTWRWWGAHLPRIVGVVVAVGLPWGLAWLVRHTRLEGRSLPRVVLGWLTFVAMPKRGLVGGRAYRPAGSQGPKGFRVYVAPGRRS